MASGRTHTAVSSFVAVLAVVSGFFLQNALIGYLVASGCILGTVISPDLDVDIGNYSIKIVKTLFGDIAGEIYRWFWWPYAKAVKHRSWISHFPVISTLLRLSYISPLFFLLYAFTGYIPGENLVWIVLGIVISDIFHIIFDFL